MKNNQTNGRNTMNKIQRNHENLSPDQIRTINNYYERKRRYPEQMRKKIEERRRVERRRDVILFFSPILIRLLMIVTAPVVNAFFANWADQYLFDYSILHTIVFCMISGIGIMMLFIAVGEWVIKRIRVNLGYYRF